MFEIIKLIPILMIIESGGNCEKVGDNGQAIGCLQIHKCIIDDLNCLTGYKIYNYEDRWDKEKSIMMCRVYLEYYGRKYEKETGKKATMKVLSALWNGGPHGWKKKSTEKYWMKVKTELDKAKK